MNLVIQLKNQSLRFFAIALLLIVSACGNNETITSTTEISPQVKEEDTEEREYVLVDGSSTIFPLSDTMAQKFMNDNPENQVIVGISGSGNGLKKFCIGDTDIANASRPIKKSEIDLCRANEIEFVEIPIAFDGLSIIVNRNNDWADCLTLEELTKIWQPNDDDQDKITNWKQIRDEFPEEPLSLFAPDADSGTFDYFTDAVTGEEGRSRKDYQASENYDIIIRGIESDWGSLGFIGFSYYEKNQDFVKLIAIDNGNNQCVEPSSETIANGTYSSLSRPLFLYVNKNSLETIPPVKAFIDYQIDVANKAVISEVGYVPLPGLLQGKVRERVEKLTTGSVFDGESAVGVKLIDKLFSEKERNKISGS
ncbi:MAG: PstS family phosphate ABC transporter substrate-binding protein [Okeania sp. SIO2G4]|uniref:PstS family phosphate ABC transporter substrate-binding protein n=1 Tax=unclassified Okeania TaxID=2634635 RepID=UPI0013BD02BE|nr:MULTISPECIES: PstS family phosphate ABC transporter substrate-binding protein [unclassified Okeania]NEP06223.1 PstS family phosphate ABC transporter substrate-binding protein [Okeania sp. SIO4D6]NEP70414.1 PstS family phosphate ABC transporter substrate-binding protein [Okeania sp. SIO2G5]NEP96166.1 PstS family phosphate ABC transporter substrate-binding protein [Okeania sp. SIO2F5]NEQ93936.1 PstS family phosphate ABC transporter substrate-binding protein [Okeania sp. SIO2G4]